MKKVSIIMPVYNTEKYLLASIGSVVNQSYENIEIVVINDGSLGNTDEIINEINDSRIKYFKRENHGIGNTRNFGINESTGDYIIFLDSDDSLVTDAIEVMVNKLEKDDLDMVIADYKDHFEKSNKKVTNNLLYFSDTNLEKSPSLINNINLGPSNKLYKKELFINNKFPEDVKYEDFALVLKLMDQAKKIGKANRPLFIFNRRTKGETSTVDKRVYDIFISLKEVIEYFSGRYQDEIDYFIVSMCTLYASKQKHQKDKEIKYKFVDDAYDFMEKYVKDYKNNEYFSEVGIIKSFIQKNKALLKIYITL